MADVILRNSLINVQLLACETKSLVPREDVDFAKDCRLDGIYGGTGVDLDGESLGP